MNVLEKTLRDLGNALGGNFSGSQLEGIKDAIRYFAIASAVANAIGGAFPGGVAVVATVVQTGMTVALYMKINRHLNVNFQENMVKVIAAAFATGIIANASTLIIFYAAAAAISFIPILGSAIAATANAAMGYIYIYVAAVIYLKLISLLARPDGTIRTPDATEAKRIIAEIMASTDMKELVQEGRSSYKQAEQDGSITEAMNHRRCPNCQTPVEEGQRFCSNCGSALC